MARKIPATINAPETPAPERGIGDNFPPDETATLLSIINKLHPAIDAVEALKAQVKAAQASVTTLYRTARLSGFFRNELEPLVEDIRRKDTREQQERELRRNRWRRIVNLPMGETDTLELTAKMPDEARDEVYWAAEGHRAGLTGLGRDLPDGIAPRMDQIWLTNYDKGQDEGRKLIAANLKTPPTQAEMVRAQAAADFAEAHPEIDVAAAARKLKADTKFMDRSAPDAFEASADELAAQGPRPSTQEAEAEAQAANEVVV